MEAEKVKAAAVEEVTKLVELESRLALLEKPKGQFILRYKHRGAPKNCTFEHAGDLEAAILRARQHCQTQGYKFIYVEPICLDLDVADKRFTENQIERSR